MWYAKRAFILCLMKATLFGRGGSLIGRALDSESLGTEINPRSGQVNYISRVDLCDHPVCADKGLTTLRPAKAIKS